MKKEAQAQALLPMIYPDLQGMGFQLPPQNKIKFEPSAPADKPQAIAYVSTEDVNQDGTIDIIHIVSPNFNRHFQGINPSSYQSMDDSQKQRILMPFAEVLEHERAHQRDYRHGEDNPFPGGEGVADQAAQQALNRFSMQATNNLNDNDILRSSTMNKEILSRLVKLANDLDEKHEFELSDHVHDVAEKFANDMASAKKMSKTAARGSITRPGDPYTYDVHPEGGYFVASAPEQERHRVGARIQPGDPGYGKVRAAHLSMKREQDDSISTKQMYGREMTPEAIEGALKSRFRKLQQLDESVVSMLNSMDRIVGPSYSQAYSRGVNHDQKLNTLNKAIDHLRKDGHEVSKLEGIARSLKMFKDEYAELVKQKSQMSAADDMAKDHAESHADDHKEDHAKDMEDCAEDHAEDEAKDHEKTASDLVKDASFNAIFWGPEKKTPFGR